MMNFWPQKSPQKVSFGENFYSQKFIINVFLTIEILPNWNILGTFDILKSSNYDGCKFN